MELGFLTQMLVSIEINGIILLDTVKINFGPGLCALTGETGAGKSILLDALGLALGMRARSDFVQNNEFANKANQAVVSATFSLDNDSPVFDLLSELDLFAPKSGEFMVLRRSLDSEGRSRAYINDQSVSVSTLRLVGENIVEIQGQFASQGLMNQASHREIVDKFFSLEKLRNEVTLNYQNWQNLESEYAKAELIFNAERTEEQFFQDQVAELKLINPQYGEETVLAQEREFLINSEKIIKAMATADTILSQSGGVEEQLNATQKLLRQELSNSAGKLDAVMDALSQASEGASEAQNLIKSIITDTELSSKNLEACEERLFALRALARKHKISVEELPELIQVLESQLEEISNSSQNLTVLRDNKIHAFEIYKNQALELSKKRRKSAIELDKAVAKELPFLKLDKSEFYTVIENLEQKHWGPSGVDHIHFEVTTNPGIKPGPLEKVSSAGELARFLLSLKVVLRKISAIPTLIFDEVDSGIGGATAFAVGERLAMIANDVQVLVITHSPQVASFASSHLQVIKKETAGKVSTNIYLLADKERREEIARMLAGAKVTDEARAAADSLINGKFPNSAIPNYN